MQGIRDQRKGGPLRRLHNGREGRRGGGSWHVVVGEWQQPWLCRNARRGVRKRKKKGRLNWSLEEYIRVAVARRLKRVLRTAGWDSKCSPRRQRPSLYSSRNNTTAIEGANNGRNSCFLTHFPGLATRDVWWNRRGLFRFATKSRMRWICCVALIPACTCTG